MGTPIFTQDIQISPTSACKQSFSRQRKGRGLIGFRGCEALPLPLLLSPRVSNNNLIRSVSISIINGLPACDLSPQPTEGYPTSRRVILVTAFSPTAASGRHNIHSMLGRKTWGEFTEWPRLTVEKFKRQDALWLFILSEDSSLSFSLHEMAQLFRRITLRSPYDAIFQVPAMPPSHDLPTHGDPPTAGMHDITQVAGESIPCT